MKRRAFLGTAAASFAAAAWPGWIRRAFADAAITQPGKLGVSMAQALGHARATGRPLLVLVVPADDAQKWERGHAFGEWINHGSVEQRWPLALADVVCAPIAELGMPPEKNEPLMVLVEPTGEARTLRGKLDEVLHPPIYVGANPPRFDDDAIIAQRIAKLADLGQQAIAPDLATLERRKREAWQAICPDGQPCPTRSARFVPADLALQAAAAPEAERRSIHRKLGDHVDATIKRVAPAGSHWADASGCGMRIEDEKEDGMMIVGCGMGHVPEKSQRFLYLYAKTPREEARARRGG
jgi:hypothetical protein